MTFRDFLVGAGFGVDAMWAPLHVSDIASQPSIGHGHRGKWSDTELSGLLIKIAAASPYSLDRPRLWEGRQTGLHRQSGLRDLL
jgi:hypothetical protein